MHDDSMPEALRARLQPLRPTRSINAAGRRRQAFYRLQGQRLPDGEIFYTLK